MNRIPLWVDLRAVPVNKRLPYLHAIDEVAAQETVLAKEDAHHDRDGLRTVAVDGNGAIKRHRQPVGKWVKAKDAKAVERAAAADGIVVVEAADWRIIPLENLVAARRDRPGTLFAVARSPEEAALFANVLDTGVHGIVLAPASPQAVYATDQALRAAWRPQAEPLTVQQAAAATVPAPVPVAGPIAMPAAAAVPSARPPAPSLATMAVPAGPGPAPTRPGQASVLAAPLVRAPSGPAPALVPAQVTAIEDGGVGDRVCIDTTSLFRDGEGLLVGSTSRSFCLVAAETMQSEFIATRPFRVNAGAVHSYLYGPDGKTRYLSELAAGQVVQALHADGGHRILHIGRAKVERRPHLLVRWRSDAGTLGHATLQDAETIRLVTPDGTTVPITLVRPGQRILVHDESHGRHAGMPIDGEVEEK